MKKYEYKILNEVTQIKKVPSLDDDFVQLQFYLKDKNDKTADNFADALLVWSKKNKIKSIENTKSNEEYDLDSPLFDDTKNKNFSLVKLDIKKEYQKILEKWLRTLGSAYLK